MLKIIADIQPKPERRKAKPSDRSLPIFERIHGRTMQAIDKSIMEAEYRFEGKGRGINAEAVYVKDEDGNPTDKIETPAIKDGVYQTARYSPCWRVLKENKDNPGEGELVEAGIPCGNKFMPWLENDDGEIVSRILIKGEQLVAQLKVWREGVADLTKKSAMGKEFHEHAINNCEPPSQKDASGKCANYTDKDKTSRDQYYDVKEDKWLDTPSTVERKAMEKAKRDLEKELASK
jgi:hypothetical protein